ncbi:hypothetical protein [Nitratireductor sp. CH_MIT9313-5]|jgi:hypothetical protein|uniref:hypothetical protein n=1 Tax=Nitratireductor sp. CH_MIT9313-5 TaxID=3107764 RepID=UPI003009F94D
MKRLALSIAALGLSTGLANAQTTPSLEGLVNVNIQDVLQDIAVDLNVEDNNIPVTVQVPVNVAANVCDVSVNVLSAQLSSGDANCTATTGSQELTQFVMQQMASGGSATGGSTVNNDRTATAGTSDGSTDATADGSTDATADADAGGTDTSVDGSVDATADADAGADTDGSADGELNADADIDAGAEADADVAADSDADVNAEGEATVDADANVEGEVSDETIASVCDDAVKNPAGKVAPGQAMKMGDVDHARDCAPGQLKKAE